MRQTVPNNRRSHREYTQQNRQKWAKLGFRNATMMLHDDDRKEIIAEVAVRKAKRMGMIADHEGSTLSQLVDLSQCNMPKTPTTQELMGLLEGIDNLQMKDEIAFAVEQAIEANKKSRGAQSNIDRTDDVKVNQRLYAKMVAYANLCHAFYTLAQIRREISPVLTTFNVKKGK